MASEIASTLAKAAAVVPMPSALQLVTLHSANAGMALSEMVMTYREAANLVTNVKLTVTAMIETSAA